ncbi:BREX-1 system adenine-specific DNA-methyltransferase PglX [Lysinibacillus sp. JK80]|uniref:BREX-1 system adenine-specific DNA-methyltransferase PglX n=1 Tax=Lysinibacillus sp. JK80 TaxID=2749809 RepID=UPI0022B9BBCA|nr:BREX-1 system adenine-specific DNA-methyltransferase PglX [Lysinibacillus sp. JK80]WBF57649.1 BREX-1 system adenine-specific DNA-methyltransferase PglX [Lysinibacillus sp. JK80]
MNKTALKNFATWSRRKLIEQVQTKALLYGIDEKNGLHIEEQFGQLLINGQTYPLSMKNAFTALKQQLEQKGYKQLLEEVAYTWFNRIIAIRYMEVHEYLPERVNVLSSSVGRVDPDILFEYDTMDLTNKQEEVRELVNAGNTEVAFRILFVAQCNALNRILPFMFEPIQDYTELLLPDFLLDAESVIKTLVQSEELTESFAEIEVIGWLYQYYIAEEKDRVFAQKTKYKKEEIPFATQLFTPKWIVQYMVQNSLGRYWTEAHREDEDLIDNWEYFIKHEEEDFHEKISPYVNKELKVEDIKLLDPAMGSGHILVYAFEVFYEIYEKCGYPERDIPRLILEHNLYGLDIDDRAYQLAAFAVVMKAAQYSRRFLRSVEREGIQLNLASIQETNHISEDVITYITQQEVGEQYNRVKAFFNQYHNAKTYGSLINITEREISFIEERFEHIKNNPVEDLFHGEQHEIAKSILPVLIQQTKIMRNEYDVLVMNPPYINNKMLVSNLSTFLSEYHSDVKTDLFAAFIERSFSLVKENGQLGYMTPFVWMFISSYEKLRTKIIRKSTINNLIQLEYSAFEEATVPICTFTLRNYDAGLKGDYLRLSDFKGAHLQPIYTKEAVINPTVSYRFNFKQSNFNNIPGKPITYWLNENLVNLFSFTQPLGSIVEAKQGLSTGDNSKFVRLWHECNFVSIDFGRESLEKDNSNTKKWIPLNKGGKYRKWYGNQEYVINWELNGGIITNSPGSVIRNPKYYFLPSVSWSDITSSDNSFRYYPSGFIFGSGGHASFPNNEIDQYELLALLNSKLINIIIKAISPTMHFDVGYFNKLPALRLDKSKIIDFVKENIKISKDDWDSFETSMHFERHPFINYRNSGNLETVFKEWGNFSDKQFHKIKNNEEEINKIIIKAADLQNEMTYHVDDKDISIRKADKLRDTISFLSYFVGCLTGRYSLDKDGLIYAGGEYNNSNFKTFKPNLKGIIKITDGSYFESDIIMRLREFLSAAFTPDTVDENIQWLAESLEMKNGENAESRLRRYFMDEFFADHCKVYQKRPIYWLVDSGKQKGLRTLIYMHRYQPDTMATIRFEHLQEIQAKYQQEIVDLENRLINPNLSATDKKKLNAEKVSFEKKIDELREFDKRLAAIATEEIEIDLDDGVKVNYEKFYRGGKGVLAKIK